MPDSLVSRIFVVLAIDVVAILGAAYLTTSTQGAPPGALRDLLVLVHIGAGTANALFLHRLLFATGGSRNAPIIIYLAGMILCFPVQWVVLLLYVARWRAQASP